MEQHRFSIRVRIAVVVMLTVAALVTSVVAIRISESRTSFITSWFLPPAALLMGALLIRQLLVLDKLEHEEQKLKQDIAEAKRTVG